MNPQHPNVERYLAAIRAFNGNDVAAALEFTSEDVVYRIPGRSPIAGEFRGIERYHAALRRARELSGNTLGLAPKAVLANDEYLLVFGRITAERPGKRLDADHYVMFRFVDGKVVEGATIPSDQYAFDAFWS